MRNKNFVEDVECYIFMSLFIKLRCLVDAICSVKAQIGFGNPIPVHFGDVPAPLTRNKVAEPNILLYTTLISNAK